MKKKVCAVLLGTALTCHVPLVYGAVQDYQAVTEADKEDIVSYTEYQLQQKKGASSKSKDGELKVYNVNLSVSGAISDVQTLVDDVRTTKSLKVSGITYSEDDEEMTTTITFKLFMI